MSVNQPASKFFSEGVQESIPVYRVLTQVSDTVVTTNDRLNPLVRGQLLEFEHDIKGIVVSSTADQAELKLNSTRSVTTGVLTNLYKTRLNQALRVSSVQGLGGLSVVCDYTPEHLKGYLGWSLYGPNGVLLALGNDSQERLTCSLVSQGLWLPGQYILKARAFSPRNLSALAYTSVIWSITESVAILKKGTYDDNSRPLTLR